MQERESGERTLEEVLEEYRGLGLGEQLLTAQLVAALPPLRSQRQIEEPVLQARFFHPVYQCDWYPIEFDPETLTFWGLVNGVGLEFGYFSLPELEEMRCPAGILTPERDLRFTPRPLRWQDFT